MARKRKGQKTPSYGFAADKQNARGKRIEDYEDTLEEGGVDDFMFKRDQIMFDQQDEESEEDLADIGEEVMAIPSRKRPVPVAEEEDDDDEDEEDEEMPAVKKRKEKVKPDVKGKGRFGKPIPDSDDSASDSGSGSGSGSESEEEGWGRQYYSVPSTRREKEKEGEYDEKREEERDLEEREVRRLQRKAREALSNGDYGLDDEDTEIPLGKADGDEEAEKVVVPMPESSDPAVLLRHMEVHEPVKLALAREWPLVVRKLEKTQRGMKKLEEEKEGQLHKGLGWLHYQTLLSYASTLAFYIHLSSLPSSSTPDLSSHPILTRLLELKKGLSDLETLDFDAASVSGDPLVPPGWASDEEEGDMDEEEKELRELIKNKKDLIARLLQNPHAAGVEEDDMEEEEEGVDGDEEDWKAAGLEDGELAELMRDAEADMDLDDEMASPLKKKKASKKNKENGVIPKKVKKSKSDPSPSASKTLFSTLTEPAFFSNPSSSKSATSQLQDAEYEHGDPLALLDADAEDKERRKRSLAFHTSKIASTANRRAAAREKRNGGDEDIPYRDRQAARDAALRKQTRGAGGSGGEALDGREMDENERKRAREVREEMELDLDGQEDDGEGYYDLIKRSKASVKAARTAAHEQSELERMEQLREIDKAGEEGPRSLTRAIEKNRGLTPRRSKAGRNPRVKKRLAYEKAKQKVGSQRAVFKGGQASLGGGYKGEKTGISTVVKSRQF